MAVFDIRGFEGDGDVERWASICLYLSRPPGVPRRASRGDRGGHWASKPGASVCAVSVESTVTGSNAE